MVQKMLWLCATKYLTKTDEPLQAGESGYNRIWKDVKNEFTFLKKAEFQPKKQENGKLKDEREG